MLSKQQPKKLSRGESSTYPTEFSDQENFNPPQQAARKILAFAEDIGIPPAGITILGGNPYVNKVGLLFKAHQAGIHSITSENIRNAHDGEKMVAGYHARVEMKDGSYFEGEGWASPMSINMKTLHNPDFINMTAETRAKNRQLRDAVGCGYVSAEETELISGIDTGADIPAPTITIPQPPLQRGEVINGEENKQIRKKGSSTIPLPQARVEDIGSDHKPVEGVVEQTHRTQALVRLPNTSHPGVEDISTNTSHPSISETSKHQVESTPPPQTPSSPEPSPTQPQAGLVSPQITNVEVNFEQPPTINHQQPTIDPQTPLTKETFIQYKKECFKYVDEPTLKKLAKEQGLEKRPITELTVSNLEKLLQTAKEYKPAETTPPTDTNGSITPFPINGGEDNAQPNHAENS